MTRNVSIAIDCGEKRCYSGPDLPCPKLLVRKFGTEYCCGLFRRDGSLIALGEDERGWLVRCGECLAAERKAERDAM